MESSILTGQVLVHKPATGLLVTGQTSPALGGDLVHAPMPLIWSDRALTVWHGHQIPVRDTAAPPAPGMIPPDRTWLTLRSQTHCGSPC